MPEPQRPQYRLASDGLRARVLGPSTLAKLVYIEKYCTAFMRAMAPKRAQGKWEALVYIDLLAGPGRCIDRERADEYDGSPLRALKVIPKFDRLYFSDKNAKNIAALRKRISAQDKSRVKIDPGDCNDVARNILEGVSSGTLGIVLLDPAGFAVHFETIRLLASRRLDILYLFPSGIGIARNLTKFLTQRRSAMDLFWGPGWRDLPAAKLAAGKMPSLEEMQSFDRHWVKSFREKMRTLGFGYQDEDAPLLMTRSDSLLYHLLFFSKHKAGLILWRGIKQITPSQQRLLPFNSS